MTAIFRPQRKSKNAKITRLAIDRLDRITGNDETTYIVVGRSNDMAQAVCLETALAFASVQRHRPARWRTQFLPIELVPMMDQDSLGHCPWSIGRVRLETGQLSDVPPRKKRKPTGEA